jgi:deoxyadenosine/deoxycytidine kinase
VDPETLELVPDAPPLYIALAGNIGVGRSLMARYLADEIGAHAQYELLDSNPFFTRFYDAPKDYAFPSQLCFLAQSFVQQCEILTSVVPVVQARSMAEHFHVFVKSMAMRGLLSEEQLHELDRSYHSFATVIRPPDLLVVLRAPVGVLWERIQERDRPGEHLEREYIAQLEERYDEWLEKYRGKALSPILEIDVAQLDVRDPEERRQAIKLVKDELERNKR